jgi:acetylornithine deacetylase/succinyl-diaminopimelate desuccinylase-like protein
LLARDGFEPSGDLIFIACADEEVGEGEQFGLPWLVEAHPDAVEADYSVNEGAGDRMVIGGNPYYFCSTAEKMSSPFVLRVRGRSGHSSVPAIPDNALVKAARLIEQLAEFRPEPEVGPEVEALLGALLGDVPPAGEVMQATRALSPAVAQLVEPLLTMTVASTMITASDRRNVIPGLCELTVDCRLLPGRTQEQAREVILDFLDEGDYEFEWTTGYGGTRSPVDTPLWEAVSAFVQETEPGARALPICVAGFTDSHWLRQKFGTVAYGFFPMRAMDSELAARLVHSADERAAIEDLELGMAFLRHAATRIGGSS